VLETDDGLFAGHQRLNVAHNQTFPVKHEGWDNRPYFIQCYIPTRTAIVFCAAENMDRKKAAVAEYVTEDIPAKKEPEEEKKEEEPKTEKQAEEEVDLEKKLVLEGKEPEKMSSEDVLIGEKQER